MVKIRRYLAPLTRTSGRGNPCRYITIHETANRSRGANANAHARLQAGTNSRQASWHYTVDSTEIVQSFDDNVRCWHAGATANNQSIAIEICVNSDGNYDRAVANAAALVAHLRRKHGIPWNRVVSHNFWTGKNCPTIMLSQRGRWDRFIAATNPNNTTAPSAPSRPPANTTPANPGPTQAEERKSWFEMASINDLRRVVREETLRNGVAYKGNGNRDLWSYVRSTHTAVGRIEAELHGENAGLSKAIESLSAGKDVSLAEIQEAAKQGVQQALDSIEADVTLNINTEDD